ncbi:MAG: DNA polymerase III subunit gamma/tau [Bryobacteraceae bacterium]|nr:DNA polymerase III subunit gamma/tau [Bryobacteraceae bacterium]
MYQVIARKYRPRTFSELIGQEHVKTTLENAISQARIAHGYIFSGQRGTGKTTVARILARCLNCEKGPTAAPCGECASCKEISLSGSPDVIEIDAASNRGINEMRELRESVRFRPARDRFKVFIIDEAHQITSEAFNALLKTLEEPPEWVAFVLCTTESHKIPNTIASRCQQFSFRSVDFDQLIGLLKSICAQENIQASDEALQVIALAGEGSVRDSLSALDQAIACCGVTLEAGDVRQLLGRFSIQTLEQVAGALIASDSRRMLEIVQELERNGQNLHHFCRELCRFLRNLLVARIAGAGTRLIAASDAERSRMGELAAQFSEEDLTRYLNLSLALFGDLQTSLQPRMHLELGMVRLVHAGRLKPIEQALADLQSGGGAPQAGPAPPKPAPPKPAPVRAAPVQGSPVQAAPPPPATGEAVGWKKKLLDALNERSLTFIADAVEHSDVIEKNGELEFVTDKIFAMAIRSSDLTKTLNAIAGQPMRVKITVGQSDAAKSATLSTVDRRANEDEATRRALEDPEVKQFREIFPGSEVRAVRNLKENV